MPVTPTYPGVYVVELPSQVRTITGVATSVAAFIDRFVAGPVNEAVQIFNFGDFEREFGGLSDNSEASYAIQQFFLNGGTEAWVVRVVGKGAKPATLEVASSDPGATEPALTVTAASEGIWGNNLAVRLEPTEIKVGPNPTDVAIGFNFIATEYLPDQRTVRRQNIFRNLDNAGAKKIVNDPTFGSQLVSIATEGTARPISNGTLSDELPKDGVALTNQPVLNVTINPAPIEAVTSVATLNFPGDKTAIKRPLTDIAPALEAAIRAAKPDNAAFSGATVRLVGRRLWILPGGREPTSRITFTNVDGGVDATATALRLSTGSQVWAAIRSSEQTAVPTLIASPQVSVTIDSDTRMASLTVADPTKLESIAEALQSGIRDAGKADSAAAFTDTTVWIVGKRLLIRSGVLTQAPTFANASASDATATTLGLTTAAEPWSVTTSGSLASVPTNLPTSAQMQVTIDSTSATLELTFGASPSLPDIATELASKIADAGAGAAFDNVTVAVVDVADDDHYFLIVPGANAPVTFDDIDDFSSDVLHLTGAAVEIAEYRLGHGPVTGSGQLNGEGGDDGGDLGPNDLMGNAPAKEGIFALEDVDLFNILCIPAIAKLPNPDALITTASTYCLQRRAFFLIDTPAGIADQRDVKAWLAAHETAVRSTPNAAFYYPQVQIPDSLDEFRLKPRGASGTMAGVYARTDALRGVWKAPAGTEANLRNVVQLDDVLTDPENGALNPLGVNCLRTFPIFGSVSWGARTVFGADQQASEWKYVPVRRTALFLEESLYRGTKWVVFEPNDEPLWAQIRLNIGAFMQNLFRQGAFQGKSPREAYFVKCDGETTIQNDIDRGIVNIVVGFAPLKPAEFVIIQFQQIAGQLQT